MKRMCVLLLLVTFSVVGRLPAADRPNVLFVFTDDQRRDTIRAWGNTYISTPNIDRIAEAGVSFTNCYVQGSMVGAVCHPSRAMLMTGRSLFHIDTSVPLLPEVFRKAGYQTFASGKMHGAKQYFNRMFEDGDELFFGGMGSHTELQVWDYDPTGRYANSARHRVESFTSEAFANAVIRFLERRDRSRPFFVYLSFTAPHDPRTPPPTYRAMYKPEEMPLPPNFMSLHPFNNGWMTGRDERLAPWPRTPEVIRRHLAEYYGMISHLDAQVGRVLDTLERQGELENTIVVFAADNGLAVGSHGLMGKQSVYEHSTGVPLIIAAPGMPANERRDALVYLYDLYPTLCELAGISVPQTVEGKSLVGVMKGTESGVRDTLYTAFMPQRGVRDRRWKLIRYTHINKTQLFDLENDPYELRDLSDDPGYQAKVQELMAVLRHWQRVLDDPQPLTTDKPEPIEFVPPER